MRILKYTILSLLTALISGCYGIQESYDYEPANANSYLEMTAWEFIEQRQDTFSLLKRAIEHVDASFPGFKNLYQQTDKKYTYLLLNEIAIRWKSTGVYGYLGINSIEDADPAKLRDVLLYHIVDGYYHSLSPDGLLTFDPINVKTLLDNEKGIMTMKISNVAQRLEYSRLKINENAGSSTVFTAVTSNLITTNGVIHVFSQHLFYKP